MKIISFFWPIIMDKFKSDFNSEIFVKEFFGRKYIEVGGLMQTGKVPEKLFRSGFTKLLQNKDHKVIKKILILGVGGGTLIKILKERFPESYLVAVDIDPVMIQLAKKHFDLDSYSNTKIIIGDVFSSKTKMGNKYDLIVVDLFRGYDIPMGISNTDFLNKLKKMLTENGNVIFNRLYFQKYKNEANTFLDKVRQIFQDVKVYKNYFNILVYCR